MERVDAGGDEPMSMDDERQGGQKDDVSLTARVDAMIDMFSNIMTKINNSDAKMDAIMMSLGPQGPQALEMGAIKEQMKISEDKNEVRFKKLEATVYQNKNKEVRFSESANKGGGANKRPREEGEEGGDTDMGGASAAGSSNAGGVPGSFWGDSKSWGVGARSGSSGPSRNVRGEPGGSDGQGSNSVKAKDCRLWVKGFGGRLTKKTLEEKARMVISQMNTGLGERDKFREGDKLRVVAWNGEFSVAPIFDDHGECERFYKRSGAPEVNGRFDWVGPIGTEGPRVPRVHKDASFDQRLMSLVFYNLRKQVAAHLDAKKVWVSETMEIICSGVKGTMFLTSGGEIYDLSKVDINHKGGPSHYLKPVYGSFLHPWGVGKEEVDGIMMRAMAKVSWLERQVVNFEGL